ncbi:sugar ABC transporter permease [Sphaerochaeta associata]|uniref:Sugar ABC transporter permease n=1 Tax=Sphaerochaeta associata TaxID=1129264 RepID=A0ABY4DAU1_9SPIR|nr:sugar ABC transporter permease [Sphaerochaeta associata]UOM51100.1 sugar ABC transporter permease [Sphaerochaeta associata]
MGISNYIKLFSDIRVWAAVQRTFIWTFFNVGSALLLGLGSALLLSGGFRGSGFIKSLVLIPWVLPSVITGYIWSLMLQEDAGIISYCLKLLQIVPKDFSWFRTGATSMAAAIMANTWRAFPFFTLMLFAKLNTIPQDHVEAATIEGANRKQLFRYVTFPYIKSTIITCTYLCFIWSFNAYDILKVMTNGGPAELTTTMSIMVQREAFQYYEISNASTMSVIMFFLMVGIIVIVNLAGKLLRKVRHV